MENDPVIRVSLPFSKYGCPIFEPSDNARVALELSIGDAPPGIPGEPLQEVIIKGNREGLKALAAAILALSETKNPDHHIHIDEEVFGSVFESTDNLTLTLSLLPELKEK